jgi:long-subunit acyl-CoA synthetase (AMP-forming)
MSASALKKKEKKTKIFNKFRNGVLHRIQEKPDAKKLFNSATLVSSRRKRSATNKGRGVYTNEKAT